MITQAASPREASRFATDIGLTHGDKVRDGRGIDPDDITTLAEKMADLSPGEAADCMSLYAAAYRRWKR